MEITVEVGKEGTITRRLPLQMISQLCGVDVDQQEVALSDEMLRGGLNDLRSVGKMNEAITVIDLRAAKDAGTFGFPPQRHGANFVNDCHCATSGSGPI
jgi:hypothetical protein